MPVRERADHAGAPPDLAQNALRWIVIWHVLIGAPSSIPQGVRISATLGDRDEGVGSTRDG